MASREDVRAWVEETTYDTEAAQDWAADVFATLERAAALLDDYDRFWDEYDLPQRTRAWLREWRGEEEDE